MFINHFLLDILKYSISGIIVFFISFYMIRAYLEKERSVQLAGIKKDAQSHILPLRLQAYERMVLFIERINPANILLRLHVPGMSAREMNNLVLSDLRAEFQHNIAQQIYVSAQAWNIITKIKEDTIGLLNGAVQSLPEHSSALDLSKVVLTHLASLESNPYDNALILIRRDVEVLF